MRNTTAVVAMSKTAKQQLGFEGLAQQMQSI